jgi:large subunit ribosomal protein L21
MGFIGKIRVLFEIGFRSNRMYAVIATGGKQYRVTEGDTLKIEKIAGEEGSKVELDQVLMVADGENIQVGTPVLDKGKVTATIKSHGRGKKVEIVKFRRRKGYKRKQGHRQRFLKVRITGIAAG